MIRGQDETRGRIDWPKVWRFRLRGTGRRESGAHAMVRDVR